MRSAWALVAVLCTQTALGQVADPARQDVAESDIEVRARTLFESATRLMKRGDYAAASVQLEEARRIAPTKLGVRMNLGLCYLKMGKTASAWGEYTLVAETDTREERRDEARQQAANLTPDLSRLDIRAPEYAALTLDGAPLVATGTALPVDPGVHVLRATAPGKVAWETSITVAPAERRVQLRVPDLVSAMAARTPHSTPPADKVQGSGASSVRAPLAILGWAVGGAGALLGSGLIVDANRIWQRAQPNCPDFACNRVGYDDWKTARSESIVGTTLLVSGLGLVLGATLVWIVTVPKSLPQK
jgi:tetratricopeptide (TPR) repeat protein